MIEEEIVITGSRSDNQSECIGQRPLRNPIGSVSVGCCLQSLVCPTAKWPCGTMVVHRIITVSHQGLISYWVVIQTLKMRKEMKFWAKLCRANTNAGWKWTKAVYVLSVSRNCEACKSVQLPGWDNVWLSERDGLFVVLPDCLGSRIWSEMLVHRANSEKSTHTDTKQKWSFIWIFSDAALIILNFIRTWSRKSVYSWTWSNLSTLYHNYLHELVYKDPGTETCIEQATTLHSEPTKVTHSAQHTSGTTASPDPSYCQLLWERVYKTSEKSLGQQQTQFIVTKSHCVTPAEHYSFSMRPGKDLGEIYANMFWCS